MVYIAQRVLYHVSEGQPNGSQVMRGEEVTFEESNVELTMSLDEVLEKSLYNVDSMEDLESACC